MDSTKIKRLRDGLASRRDLLSAATYFRTIMEWESVPQCSWQAILDQMGSVLPPRVAPAPFIMSACRSTT